MSRALLLFFLASFSASAQTVVPARKVVQGHGYAYDKDGLRQYTATQPKSGVYRTIKYNYIETTDTYRINGLPCTVDCAEEMVGYRKARAKGIADIKDCPKESELKLEALGCSLWVLEQKK